jgi:hypothetical protein
MALVSLSEYANAHGLKVTNVRTAQRRGKLLTAVKRHGVWMVDEAEPWYMERRKDWYTDEADVLTADEIGVLDRVLMIRHYAQCGEYGETFAKCLGEIPTDVREALPAQQVAALVDAIHDSYERGYRAGMAEAGL